MQQGLNEEQLNALLGAVEQLRIAEKLPFPQTIISQCSNADATPARPQRSLARSSARSAARPEPRSVRQATVSYKERSSSDDDDEDKVKLVVIVDCIGP